MFGITTNQPTNELHGGESFLRTKPAYRQTINSLDGMEPKSSLPHPQQPITFFFMFYICTMHLDTTKVYYSPMNTQVIALKIILKFTIK
jgi:hypothetical protein